MAPNKKMMDQHNYSKFGTRPPDIIPLTYMRDNELMDNDVLNQSLEAPLGSSTLTRKNKALTKSFSFEIKKTSTTVVGSCDRMHEVILPNKSNVTNNQSKDSFQSSIQKPEEDISTGIKQNGPVHLKPFKHNFHQKLYASSAPTTPRISRKLPIIPSERFENETSTTARDTAAGVSTDNLASYHPTCIRTTSLPSSPSQLTGTRRRSASNPSRKLSQKAHSLTNRLRNSLRSRPVAIVRQERIEDLTPDLLFPDFKERENYEYAKRRGRRGAVISLEVNQSVSFVKTSTGKDRYLEFSFVPKTP